ncbi:MAG: hypothetical protein FGM54_00150 [Chitinophagaceae bacterium]|nr:hypothetical protein [Chitinophagaceae bacterium]
MFKRGVLLCFALLFGVSLMINAWSYLENPKQLKETIKKRIGRADDTKPANTKTYAYHYINDSITPIQPILNANKLNLVVLPDTQLMVKPGIYQIHGATYEFKREGLYRIMRPGHFNRQVIVYQSDFYSLLSATAWIVTHGTRDNKLPFTTWYQKACTEKVVVTCSRASTMMHELLKRAKIESRKVQCFTTRNKTQFFIGHVMLEVMHPELKTWFLVDIDNNRYFTQNGTPIDAHTFYTCLHRNKEYQWVSLSEDDWLDADGYMNGLINENLLSESVLHQWYKDVTEHIVINNIINSPVDFDSVSKANPQFIYADNQDLHKMLYNRDVPY